MSCIALHNLTLGYDRHPAVHHLNGTIAQGELLAIIGPNGAGKSSLLRGLAGLLKPLSGRIERQGVSPRDIAYLPQHADIDRSFPISVFDFVATGLWRRCGWAGAMSGADQARVRAAIASVGLVGFERRTIDTLSGGQMQRMLFARLCVQDARIIMLDEPFNAIDAKTVSDLVGLMLTWHREGRTIAVALHDFELVKRIFPKCLLLAREVVAWGDTGDVLTEANLLRARRMSEAFDDGAAACAQEVA